jgi:hypothetical protein
VAALGFDRFFRASESLRFLSLIVCIFPSTELALRVWRRQGLAMAVSALGAGLDARDPR